MVSFERIERLKEKGRATLHPTGLRVSVGLGTCGRASGAEAVYSALDQAFTDAGLNVRLARVGCRGLCNHEPLVELSEPGGRRRAYGAMTADAALMLAEALAKGEDPSAVEELARHEVPLEWLMLQERRVLSHCGVIDPFSIEEYIAAGGYQALADALDTVPSAVRREVEASGLRGRGGAGFPTGRKWRALAEGAEGERYFIVNGDEGDPGAYMDRGLLESDPHRVLEGLILACYATDAHQAYVFIRAEYPLAVETMKAAIEAAYEVGLLGESILGSGFSLDVSVVRGAGAFLCGESTAMVNVLEGKPCTTRPKPPHLVEQGLWGRPTCINNVETLANVPLIVSRGADWFREAGTVQSPGTKVLSVTGAVEESGLFEVPLGVSIGYVAEELARADSFKGVQIGGPSGAILPSALADLELTFEGLTEAGGMMGSGGFVVLGEGQCIVDTALYLTRFSRDESCRHCKVCFQGLGTAADVLERLVAGVGTEEDLALLEQTAERTCADKSLCGLGRTGLKPLLTSLRYFREEYKAHLRKTCPALVCKELVSFEIMKERCEGERCCLTSCPGNAIRGSFGKPGRIVSRLCLRCGMCLVTCCYNAVRKVSPRR